MPDYNYDLFSRPENPAIPFIVFFISTFLIAAAVFFALVGSAHKDQPVILEKGEDQEG